MAATRTAVVAGGTGGIGEGIVKALLKSGYEVYVPIREVDKSDRLLSYVADAGKDRLHLVPGDLGNGKAVAASRKKILETAKTIDLVVVSVGSSFYGHSLHKIAQADWDRLISENLATHFNMIHEYLAYLHEKNEGVFVTLTGPEGDFVHPETGLMSVVASAQKMMARVAAQEAAGTGVRVYSITSKNPIATRSRGEQSGETWVTAEDVGRYVAALAERKLPNAVEPLHQLESRKVVEKALQKSGY